MSHAILSLLNQFSQFFIIMVLVYLSSLKDIISNSNEGIDLNDIKYKLLYIDIKLISQHKLREKAISCDIKFGQSSDLYRYIV
jgi:hypothetical protein